MYDKHSGQMCGMCKRINFTQQCDEFPRKILKENIRTSCFHDKYANKEKEKHWYVQVTMWKETEVKKRKASYFSYT